MNSDIIGASLRTFGLAGTAVAPENAYAWAVK